ncbi:MAG: BON domain-containing protein [Gammaproteobacteria bacterium]|nr:BON domain-containing protein [Gammaproteobacteria bacterium]
MKLLAILAMMLTIGGCTSMLLGSSGKSAGSSIGQDSRGGAQISADERISTAIRSRFAADDALGPLRLRVETHNGIVTLHGIAGSFTQRDRAVRMAIDISGVVRVDNQISINTT